mmetsp:Transcript_48012/g.153510  ORF Transcript_48012/g.153510 Transcript_48012/m.153510 type:complete len:109 (+) Transcript_48012:292-618(+)
MLSDATSSRSSSKVWSCFSLLARALPTSASRLFRGRTNWQGPAHELCVTDPDHVEHVEITPRMFEVALSASLFLFVGIPCLFAYMFELTKKFDTFFDKALLTERHGMC